AGPPQTPPVPVRWDLAVIGPMARSAVDLALELAVVAGPDEVTEGIGYKLALPPPRREKLADYRVLVIDKHPLCPTADSVTGALNRLAKRLGHAGCKVMHESAKLPDLGLTTRNYAQLLLAFFSAELPIGPEQVEAAVQALPAGDQTLAGARLRGLGMSHPDWIRASRLRGGLRARWLALC